MCVCVPGPCRATYVRLSPRWPLLLRPCACVPVLACHLVGRRWRVTRFVCLGPRLVSQGLWANAPSRAHTEALAGRLTSLRLSNVPPSSPPRRLGGRLSHTQLWEMQLLHAQLFYTQLSCTQLVHAHTISQLPHTTLAHTHPHASHLSNAHTHNSSTYNFLLLSILHHLLCLLP
jgi:hypothetical protein